MKHKLGLLLKAVAYAFAAIFAYFLSMYAFVAIHEFGHSLAMLAVGVSPATIVIGGGELISYARISDTLIAIGSVPTSGLTYSGDTTGIVLQTWQLILVSAAGTIAVSMAFLVLFLWAGVYRVRPGDTARYLVLSSAVACAPLLGPFWPIALLVVPIDWQLKAIRHLFSPFSYLVFRYPKASIVLRGRGTISAFDVIRNYRFNPFMVGTALVFVRSWVQSVGNMLPISEGSDGFGVSAMIFRSQFGDLGGIIALEGWGFILVISLVLFGISLVIHAMRTAYRTFDKVLSKRKN